MLVMPPFRVLSNALQLTVTIVNARALLQRVAWVEVATGLGLGVENTRLGAVFGLTQGHRPRPLSARDRHGLTRPFLAVWRKYGAFSVA